MQKNVQFNVAKSLSEFLTIHLIKIKDCLVTQTTEVKKWKGKKRENFTRVHKRCAASLWEQKQVLVSLALSRDMTSISWVMKLVCKCFDLTFKQIAPQSALFVPADFLCMIETIVVHSFTVFEIMFVVLLNIFTLFSHDPNPINWACSLVGR